MTIYIPTLNRSKRQLTANTLGTGGIDCVLVINQKDHDDYGDLRTLRWPGNGHLRAKRQWILDHAKGKFVMMDDDLRFYTRSKDGQTLYSSDESEIARMVRKLESYLDEFPHGGIMNRRFGQSRPREAMFNTGYISLGAYNKHLFKKPYPKFRLEMFPDHDFCLQLLTTGHPSFLLTEFAFEEDGGAPGGMNTFRTPRAKFKDRMRMCKLFPSVVERKPEYKRRWRKEWNKTGTDQQFRFNWKRAYRPDRDRNGSAGPA
jgi:hypothetical protein